MTPYTGQLPKHLSVITMPLRKDRPEPPGPDWMASKCPECGQDAWERADTLEIMAQFTQLKKMCRECIQAERDGDKGDQERRSATEFTQCG